MSIETVSAPLLARLLFPSYVWAWGDKSHEIICEIALQEMKVPEARTELARLLALDPEFKTFSAACTWPDHPRSRPSEHYVNVPRTADAITGSGCPLPGVEKCLLTAIPHDAQMLGDRTASDADRLAALKYLGHWVGDIHQPLHVSFEDDRGGNEIRATGVCRSQFSLHAVWDACLVEKALPGLAVSEAKELRSTLTDAQRGEWLSSQPFGSAIVRSWATESLRISTSPSVHYCTKKEGACWYSEGKRELSPGEVRRTELVDLAYAKAQQPVVEEQLLKAGVRLGWLLDQLLVAP